MAMSADILKDAYYKMLLLRRFEEKAGQSYGMGLIAGFCHLYIGQEAVAVGMQMALTEGDGVITSYRDHGPMLAAGSDPKAVMAELYGRIGGCSLGKGGSMHMFDLTRQFYGGHGIVGAQVPIGTGIAFAYKYQKKPNICVVYFGDGAVNQGQVYEAFNMAKLWNLPVLYVVENNEYAMGTAVSRASGNPNLYQRGESFGIPGKQVEGMDFLTVYKAAKEAVDYVRSGKGPMLLEMKTYRYRGHSMSDPAKYRTKEEVNKYRETHDCLEGLATYMKKNKIADDKWLQQQEDKVKVEVADALAFAETSPEPGPEQLHKQVYIEV
ncbi:MAG: pyruvate dehydrogenase (acetyl-transferring) E1 component subunit alpha [Proteobacteria bacterium]|nr:pyruvate dehydrogenase (acetyl-transferring) E1 component subunit alpha [Pseudomonadota bacterium]